MAKTGKRGRPKKVAGEPPSGEGLNSEELKAHTTDAFGVSKPDPEELEDVAKTAAAEELKPEVIAEPETPAEPPPVESEKEVVQAPEVIEAKEEGETADAVRDTKEEGEGSKEEIAGEEMQEDPEAIKMGFLRDTRKLKDRIAELEQQLQVQAQPEMLPGQGASAAFPQQTPTGAPGAPAISWDSEGRPILPDPNDPAVRAYFRALQEPTPEERQIEAQRQWQAQRLAEQREFEATKAAFIQEDPRREPIVERVQAASQFLDLKAQEVMNRTGERPQGGPAIAQFLERYGIADEFRRYVPEVDAEGLPLFLEIMFGQSNLLRRDYMTRLCERAFDAKPGAGGGKGAKQGSTGQQFNPPEIPPRLAAQGAVQADRTGKPGKEERLEELSKELRENPFRFTKAMHEELKDLRKDLGIDVATLS